MAGAGDQFDRDGDHRAFDKAGERPVDQDQIGVAGDRDRRVERRQRDEQNRAFEVQMRAEKSIAATAELAPIKSVSTVAITPSSARLMRLSACSAP